VIEAKGGVFTQQIAFDAKFITDFTKVRPLPTQQGIVELVVCHTLLKKACHLAFTGDTKTDALSVIYTGVFHICSNAVSTAFISSVMVVWYMWSPL